MNNPFLRQYLLRLPALIVILVIWALSSQPTLPTLPGALGWDKLQHCLAYAVLAFCAGIWLEKSTWRRKPVFCYFWCVIIASLYGVIDEFHQHFVPGRDSTPFDWMADTVGGLIGAAVLLLVMRYLNGKQADSDNRSAD
jgi:VanZ family protein